MLETLFIWGLILVPLGVAVVLIAYRARYFVLGVALIILLMMLIWGALRLGIMFGESPAPLAIEMNGQPIACVGAEGDALPSGCKL